MLFCFLKVVYVGGTIKEHPLFLLSFMSLQTQRGPIVFHEQNETRTEFPNLDILCVRMKLPSLNVGPAVYIMHTTLD